MFWWAEEKKRIYVKCALSPDSVLWPTQNSQSHSACGQIYSLLVSVINRKRSRESWHTSLVLHACRNVELFLPSFFYRNNLYLHLTIAFYLLFPSVNPEVGICVHEMCLYLAWLLLLVWRPCELKLLCSIALHSLGFSKHLLVVMLSGWN